MKISLLHPSRSRPEKAKATARKWIEQAGVPVEHIFSVDNSDPRGKEYFEVGFTTLQYPNESVVEATNRAAKVATGDLLLYLSDDFDCFENWGVKVVEQFKDENRPLLLKVHDALQKFDVRVCTIPIINISLYNKLNYFWHPEYKSMFVDCDLFETCNRIGALKFAEHLVFPHLHYSNGKCQVDETYRASEANWNQGLTIFNRRKLEGFPI